MAIATGLPTAWGRSPKLHLIVLLPQAEGIAPSTSGRRARRSNVVPAVAAAPSRTHPAHVGPPLTLTDAFITSIAGLLGVIVGAALTPVLTLRMTRRATTRSAAR